MSLLAQVEFDDVLGASGSKAGVTVSTRFMENYEVVRAVSGSGAVVPFLNRSGLLDVYSVGTANKVFLIRSPLAAEDGWIEKDLRIVASQISVFPGAGDDIDHPSILGLDDRDRLTLSRYELATGEYVQAPCEPPKATRSIKQLASTKNLGNVYVNVILDNDELGTNFIKPDGTWAAQDWVPVKSGTGTNATAKRLAMCANDPVQKSIFVIGTDGYVYFSENNFRFSTLERLPPVSAIDLSVVVDGDGLLNIFAVSADYKLWVKKEKKHSTGGIQFEPWQQIGGTRYPIIEIKAGISGTGQLEVFAIGVDRRLVHTRQVKGDAGKVAWAELFTLGNPMPSTVFNVGRDHNGLSQAYGVTSDARLFRMWQDPSTTTWNNTEIRVQTSGAMATVPTHSTEVVVIDDAGLAIGGEQVVLRAQSLVTVRINGFYYQLNDSFPTAVKTNPSGKLVIERFTNSLSSPSYAIETRFMVSGETVAIEPNGALQDRIHGISADEIWNAKRADGRPLLEGDFRTRETADSLSNIMRRSMSLGMPADSSRLETRYLRGRPHQTGVRHVPRSRAAQPFALDLSQVEEQHWEVDFTTGAPRFREYTREEVRLVLEGLRSSAAPGIGFSLFGVDLGDIWNAIKTGVADIWDGLKRFVVTTIIDPITGWVKEIKLGFELVIDGVRQFIERVIEFVQQAFEMLEAVWAKIKVFFEDLYWWLAFFFAWKDIARTADAIRHTFNTSADFVTLGVRASKGWIGSGIDGIEWAIDAGVDEFLKKINPTESVGAYTDEHSGDKGQLDDGSAHNPLLNGFVDHCNSAQAVHVPVKALFEAMRAEGPIDTLLQKMVDLRDNFQFHGGVKAFDEAFAYFEQIGSNPGRIVQLLLSGAVKLMQGIILFGIEAAKGVVLSMLDIVADVIQLVKTLLNTEFEIPFVSQLWKLITGSSLSIKAIDLFAYVLAIPATLIYKLARNEAPFSEDGLRRFEEGFTVDWLAEKAHLVPTTVRRAAYAVADLPDNLFVVFGVLCSASNWIGGFVDTFDLAFNLAKVEISALGTASVFFGLAGAFFSVPWLSAKDAGPMGCEGKALGNTVWLLHTVFGPVRAAVVKVAGDDRVPNDVDKVMSTLWGAARLGMHIAQAVQDHEADGAETAENIIDTLNGQLFQFLGIKAVVVATEGVSLVALMAFVFFGSGAVGAIHLNRALQSGEPEPRRRRVRALPELAMA